MSGMEAADEAMDSSPPTLDVALRRLAAALDLLEAAASRRAGADRGRAELTEEYAVMQDDRRRLAVELDGALARGRTLEDAHQAVARRLGHAIASVRAIVERAEPAGEGAP